jgi:predicted transcriptional regulator
MKVQMISSRIQLIKSELNVLCSEGANRAISKILDFTINALIRCRNKLIKEKYITEILRLKYL